MKTAVFKLTSASPYSQSRLHGTPKTEKESHADYETRTWVEKAHFEPSGEMFIPPMAFKQALDKIATRLGKIPGKGAATYTKHFKGGVLITDPLGVGVMRSDFDEDLEELDGDPHRQDTLRSWGGFVNADGKRGSGTRVFRRFPEVKSWSGNLSVMILDEVVTKSLIEESMSEAGKFIGIGRYRAENGGLYGRFHAELVEFG